MVEVRQARYFVAVAEELHFGRAAQRLGMSQPPLSQAIQQLERELKAQLLSRSTRSVSLTETGRIFAEECRQLIAAARRAEDVAARADAGYYGTLRIGAVTSAFADTLPGIVDRFRSSRPDVALQVSEIDTPQGRTQLLDYDIDVAIIRLAEPVRHLRTRPLRRDSFVVAFPPGHPRAGSPEPIDLALLRDEPWVWLRREVSPDYHDQLLSACRTAGFTPDTPCRANSITTQLAMVEAGLGVTMVPNTSARVGDSRVHFRALAQRFDLVELSLVCRDVGGERLVEHFIQCAATETSGAVEASP